MLVQPIGSIMPVTPRTFYGGDSVSASSSRFLRPQVSLGDNDDRLMTWSTNLNIYRVNRFSGLSADDGRHHYHPSSSFLTSRRDRERHADFESRFDIVEQMLMRNMIEAVEDIFVYVGIETVRDCLLVCRLWYDFLARHLFKRKV